MSNINQIGQAEGRNRGIKVALTVAFLVFATIIIAKSEAVEFWNSTMTRWPLAQLNNLSNPFLVNDSFGVDIGGGIQYIWCENATTYIYNDTNENVYCTNNTAQIGTFIDEGNGSSFGSIDDNTTTFLDMGQRNCNATHCNSHDDSNIVWSKGASDNPSTNTSFGKIGSSQYFDGTDWLEHDNDSYWNSVFPLGGPQYMGFWIYAGNPIDPYDVWVDREGFFTLTATTNDALNGYFWHDSNERCVVATQNNEINRYNWTFYEFIVTGVVGECTIYENLVNVTISQPISSNARITTNPFYVGRSPTGTRRLVGNVDNLILMNRVPSDAERTAIYNNTNPDGYSSVGAMEISYGELSIEWVDPITDINFSYQTFRNFIVNVTCINGDCGNVTASLDPIQIETITEEDNSVFQWIPANDVFRFYGDNFTFDIELTVTYNGNEINFQQIRNAFPDVNISKYINKGVGDYKFSVEFTNIPQQMAQNINFFTYRLVDWINLTGSDFEEESTYTLQVKEGEVILSFQDLIDSGYTLTRADKFSVNVYGNASHFVNNSINLDPTLSTSTNEGSNVWMQSWSKHIFYDHNVDRIYVTLIDNDTDVAVYSAPFGDLTNFTYAQEASGGNIYGYDDYDAYYDGANIHFASAPDVSDHIQYRMCTPSDVSPYLTCNGTNERAFDSSLQGGQTADDAAFPSIFVGSDGCAVIAFDFEDDSVAAVGDEHGIAITKESSPCQDGDWDHALDTEAGFPLYNIQTDAIGYLGNTPTGIESYGDNDARIFWVNTDTTSDYQLMSTFFNGSLKNVTHEVVLNADIEGTQVDMSFDSVYNGSSMYTFGLIDDADNISLFRLDSKTDTSVTIETTNLETHDTSSYGSGLITTVYNNVTDDIILIATDRTDDEDIYYELTEDGGGTFITKTLWQDEAGINEVKFLTSSFNYINCTAGIRWLNGSTSPWVIEFDEISLAGCEPPPVSKGLISTVVGDTPFYTTDANPQNQTHIVNLGSMEDGDSIFVTWAVNATGLINSSHIFFANATSDITDVANVSTSNINVTISEPPPPVPITICDVEPIINFERVIFSIYRTKVSWWFNC